MKQFVVFVSSFCIIFVVLGYGIWFYFGPVGETQQVVFIVPKQSASFDVPKTLFTQKLVRNESAFRWLYGLLVAGKTTVPGGYRLVGTMTALGIIRKITAVPDFVWVVVREGLRKEQVSILLAEKLGWPENYELHGEEGTFFPDTYLLPRDESADQISNRFLDHFNEKFAPYTDIFAKQNVKWTTAIKIASLIQREAGGSADMPIISGVIWNRLDKNMALQIDATIQYALGNAKDGWWPLVKGSDTRIDSPYNTYLYKGLPPTPIANPGISAIDAVAHPAETDCLFYLHDHDRQIHCSVTYAEHVENIKKYLQ